VGRKSLLPRDRCIAVSCVRLLLDDTTFFVSMIVCITVAWLTLIIVIAAMVWRMFSTSCSNVLLTSPTGLVSWATFRIGPILSVGEKPYVVPISVMFVLSPGRYDNFTPEQCEAILKATFEYIVDRTPSINFQYYQYIILSSSHLFNENYKKILVFKCGLVCNPSTEIVLEEKYSSVVSSGSASTAHRGLEAIYRISPLSIYNCRLLYYRVLKY